jgi:hypothetical protein
LQIESVTISQLRDRLPDFGLGVLGLCVLGEGPAAAPSPPFFSISSHNFFLDIEAPSSAVFIALHFRASSIIPAFVRLDDFSQADLGISQL